MLRARLVARLVMDVSVPGGGAGKLSKEERLTCTRLPTLGCAVTGVSPLEMCLTKEVVPRDTPLTKAPGPRVRPSYGSRKKSEMPFPTLRTRLAGLPRISRDPTTQPWGGGARKDVVSKEAPDG